MNTPKHYHAINTCILSQLQNLNNTDRNYQRFLQSMDKRDIYYHNVMVLLRQEKNEEKRKELEFEAMTGIPYKYREDWEKMNGITEPIFT